MPSLKPGCRLSFAHRPEVASSGRENDQTTEREAPSQRNSDVARTAEAVRARRARRSETENESEREQSSDIPLQRSRGLTISPFKSVRVAGLDFSGKVALAHKGKGGDIGGFRSKLEVSPKLSPAEAGAMVKGPMVKMAAAARSFDTGLEVDGWVTSSIDFELLGAETELESLFELYASAKDPSDALSKVKLITAGATVKGQSPHRYNGREFEISASLQVSLPPETVAALLKQRGKKLAGRMMKQGEKMIEIVTEIAEVERLLKEQERIASSAEKIFNPKMATELGGVLAEKYDELKSAYERTQRRLAKLGQHFRNSQVGGKMRKFLSKTLAPMAKKAATVLKLVSKVAAWPLAIVDALDAAYLLISWTRGEAVIWPFESRLPGSGEGDNVILPSFMNQNERGKRIDGTERFDSASPALTRLFKNMTGPSSNPGGRTKVDAEYLRRFFEINDKYPITEEKADALEALARGDGQGVDSLDSLEKLAQLSVDELRALAPREGETMVEITGLDVESLKALAKKRAETNTPPKPKTEEPPNKTKDPLARFDEKERERIRAAAPMFQSGKPISVEQRQKLENLLARWMTKEKRALFLRYPNLRRIPFVNEDGLKRLADVLAMTAEEIEAIGKSKTGTDGLVPGEGGPNKEKNKGGGEDSKDAGKDGTGSGKGQGNGQGNGTGSGGLGNKKNGSGQGQGREKGKKRSVVVYNAEPFSGKTQGNNTYGRFLPVAASALQNRPLIVTWEVTRRTETGTETVQFNVAFQRVNEIDWKTKQIRVTLEAPVVFARDKTGLPWDVVVPAGSKGWLDFK